MNVKNNSRKLALVLLLGVVLIPTLTFSQIQVWGNTENGGPDQIGSTFNVYDDGTDFQTNSVFSNTEEGANPRSGLLDFGDGWYYGTTSANGLYDGGTLFRVNLEGNMEVLHHFNPDVDGSNSKVELLAYSSSIIIGTTSQGGQFNGGTIFEYEIGGGVTVIHNLNPAIHGNNSSGVITYNSNDNIMYLTAAAGGQSGHGTLIGFTPNQIDVVHHFEGDEEGEFPQGGVTLGSDGLLYGVTQFGGENNQGSIYSFDPEAEDYIVIYHLNASTTDGRYPLSTLIETTDGDFIGTCSEGGSNGNGSVFKVSTDGTYEVLQSLISSVHGSFPKSGLTTPDAEIFFGACEFGGDFGFGTLYSIDTDGNFAILHDFEYAQDGSNPLGRPSLNSSGEIVSLASNGGTNNFGTVYTYNMDGTFSKVYDLSLPLSGSIPHGLVSNGNSFLGTTQNGGTQNQGVVFQLELDGTRTEIHSLDPFNDGQLPNDDLLVLDDGTIYGTARFGGLIQSGTVFAITPDGSFTAFHHFTGGAQGQFPIGGVTLHSNGQLYGTTSSGGDFGNGVIYTFNDGDYEVVASLFTFVNGGGSEATMVEANGGKLYGLARLGGSSNNGTLFEFDPVTNAVNVMHSFNGATDGSYPRSDLILHSDGALYGTTSSSGPNGGGTLFKYDFDTGFEVLHSFDPSTDGNNSAAGVIEDLSTGNVIGFCKEGGLFNMGSAYSYSPDGDFEVIYHFTGADASPTGKPALFYPECYGDEDCVSTDPCAIGVCNFGICEEVAFNPVFEIVDIGLCQIGLDIYDLEISLQLDGNPGGEITIAGQSFSLESGALDYTFTLENMPADGETLDLAYTFELTGCSGTSGNIGTAPDPCPPVEVTFVVHTDDLEVSPEGIHLGGAFQEWSPDEIPLTMVEDNIWEVTVTVGAGDIEYNFFNGSSLFDGEYVIGECASFGKRQATISESVTIENCWASCAENCTVGLDDMERIAFAVYPNIIDKGQSVRIEHPSFEPGQMWHIVDINGRFIKAGQITGENMNIDTNNLESGMYFIQISNSDSQIIGAERLIIR